MARLDNKVVLITGGTTGIGAATARLFQAEGATVIATGSSEKTVAAARAKSPGVELVVADQADPQASKALVEQIKARHGRIDVLFVNAGIALFAPLEAADEAHFDKMFNINVRGAYFMVKHAAPAIPDGGSIMMTGSVAGARGYAGSSAYSASKGALRSLGRTFAAEFAPRNVRVNVITPGPIDTPIFSKAGFGKEEEEQVIESLRVRTSFGRVGHPDEVAAVALFLATDATFMTGDELFVDGGMVNT